MKSLEREVVSPPSFTQQDTVSELLPSNAPTVADDKGDSNGTTPAEDGTSLVDFQPGESTTDSLTHSAYAITDDEERAAIPTQTGEWITTTQEESTPETIASQIDGALLPDEEPKLAPTKGKRVRKITSEVSAGTESEDEPGAMTVEELES